MIVGIFLHIDAKRCNPTEAWHFHDFTKEGRRKIGTCSPIPDSDLASSKFYSETVHASEDIFFEYSAQAQERAPMKKWTQMSLL